MEKSKIGFSQRINERDKDGKAKTRKSTFEKTDNNGRRYKIQWLMKVEASSFN